MSIIDNNYAIKMKNITKIFGNFVANDNINFFVKKNEVHALIGENGAGKSTLMSILFGLYKPNNGSIYINNKLENINSPIKANKLGIGMIHQHFKLVDIFTVLDNIILGNESKTNFGFLNRKKIQKELYKIIFKYNLEIDFKSNISNISVGMQQRVEILKVLYRGADIIVFDEPTAVLTSLEIKSLLKIIKDLKKNGKTIIFISHKLNEIKKIADSATVISKGKVIDFFNIKDRTTKQISESMFGKQILEIKNQGKKPKKKILLKIENLLVKKKNISKLLALDNLNIIIKSGEIVSIAGIEGNGQLELIESLIGIKKIYSGKIIFDNIEITKKNINNRYKLGMSYIPEDRHKYGLILDFKIIDNMFLQNINKKPFSNFGILNKSIIQLYAQNIFYKYNIKSANSYFSITRELSRRESTKNSYW